MRHNSLSELFKDIADAIRNKTGSTEPLLADDFDLAIAEMHQEIKVLWSNPSPTSSFSSKTIPLDLSKYACCGISYRGSVTDSTSGTEFFYNFPQTKRIWGRSSGSTQNRNCTVDVDGVTFEVGRTGTTNNNNYLIPTTIRVVEYV